MSSPEPSGPRRDRRTTPSLSARPRPHADPVTSTAPAPIGPARSDDYLQWRQRIADRQAMRRQPPPPPKAAADDRWDPAALFRSDAPADLPLDVPEVLPHQPPAASEPETHTTIDLRAESPVIVVRGPVDIDGRRQALDDDSSGSSGGARYDAVMARLHRRRPVVTTEPPSPASVADGVRELNRLRLEGLISEDDFKARKADLFHRGA